MSEREDRKIEVRFYRTKAGGEPVREWSKKLRVIDRNAIGRDIMRVQYGWPVEMPLCQLLGGGLHEVRTTLPSDKIARVLFYLWKGKLVLLSDFIKKTQTTQDSELQLARSRRKEIEDD